MEFIYQSDIHVNCIPACDYCGKHGEVIGCSVDGNWMFCNFCQEYCCSNGGNGHEYSEIQCTHCQSEDNCWNCSVKVTDDSTGEGIFTCRNCGSSYEYQSQIIIR